MANIYVKENGSTRYLMEDGVSVYLRESQTSSGGQQGFLAQGATALVLTIALVGLSLTAGQGTVVASGSGATIALTGQAITSAHGIVVQSASIIPTGRQANISQGALFPTGRSLIASSQGTATALNTILLAGQVSTSGQGLVTPNAAGTVPLVGTALTGSQGAFGIVPSVPTAGSASTSAAGTMIPVHIPTVTAGQVLTSASGTMVASGPNNVTVHITGEETTSEIGLVAATPSLLGLAMTSASGILSPSCSLPLLGEVSTSGLGVVSVGQDPNDTYIPSFQGTVGLSEMVPLVGSVTTSASGIMTVTADTVQPLTGSESVLSVGTLIPSMDVPLLGEMSTSEQGAFGVPGEASLSGLEIVAQTGTIFTDGDRTQSIVGSEMASATGILVANPRLPLITTLLVSGIGTLSPSGGTSQRALTGSVATFTQGTLGVIGEDEPDIHASGEGCGITTDTSGEGCGIVKGVSGETTANISGPAREV